MWRPVGPAQRFPARTCLGSRCRTRAFGFSDDQVDAVPQMRQPALRNSTFGRGALRPGQGARPRDQSSNKQENSRESWTHWQNLAENDRTVVPLPQWQGTRRISSPDEPIRDPASSAVSMRGRRARTATVPGAARTCGAGGRGSARRSSSSREAQHVLPVVVALVGDLFLQHRDDRDQFRTLYELLQELRRPNLGGAAEEGGLGKSTPFASMS